MRVIGITGKAGSGKDTVANHLVEQYGFRLYRFAAALKQICRPAFQLEDRDDLAFKETPDPRWVSPLGKARTPREIWQIIGSEGFRAVDPDYWVKRLVKDLTEDDQCLRSLATAEPPIAHHKGLYVISDLRFANEAAALRLHFDAEIWRVWKEGGTGTDHGDHVSELGVKDIGADYDLGARHGRIPYLLEQADKLVLDFLGIS